jgi:hypothetical protein
MSTQQCEILYADSQDMLILSFTVASCYYNCCTGGSRSPRKYGSVVYLAEFMSATFYVTVLFSQNPHPHTIYMKYDGKVTCVITTVAEKHLGRSIMPLQLQLATGAGIS